MPKTGEEAPPGEGTGTSAGPGGPGQLTQRPEALTSPCSKRTVTLPFLPGLLHGLML